MVVFVIEKAPNPLRGELTKWALEVKPGVFVGKINSKVRLLLWEKIVHEIRNASALMIYSTNTEQGFDMQMVGHPKRSVVDFDGVRLIKIAE